MNRDVNTPILAHPSHRYTNAVLSAIACLLLLNLLSGRNELPTPSAASAQDYKPSDLPFNSGDQRNRMTTALESIDGRLSMIEAKLEKGINVKVVDMPPVKLQDDRNRDGGGAERKADKPAPRIEVKNGPAPANPTTPPANPK